MKMLKSIGIVRDFQEIHETFLSKQLDIENWTNVCKFRHGGKRDVVIVSIRNILVFIKCKHSNGFNDEINITKTVFQESEITALEVHHRDKLVIVGFINGFINIYDYDGNRLISDQLEKEQVQNVGLKLGLLTIHYDSYIFIIQLAELVQKINKGGNLDQLKNLCERKWKLPFQTPIKNSVLVGVNNQSYFDYLLTATQVSGFTTVSKSNVPNQLLTLCVGKDDFLNFVYNYEGFIPVQLTHVAKVVSQKLQDVLPFSIQSNSDFLIATENTELQCSFSETGRSVEIIKVSPCTKYSLLIDNFDQILIIDNFKNSIIRTLSKYNHFDHQVDFFYYFEHKLQKTYEFVLILNTKNGFFELYPLVYGDMFQVIDENAINSALIASTNHKPIILSSSGHLYDIVVPFYVILEIEIKRNCLDEHTLYKAIKHYLKSNCVEDIATQLTTLLKRFRSEQIICKCLMLISLSDSINLDFLLEIAEQITVIDSFYCQNLSYVIQCYQFLCGCNCNQLISKSTENGDKKIEAILNSNDYKTLTRLNDLFKSVTRRKTCVRFNISQSEDLKFKEFLQVFELNSTELKSNWELCPKSYAIVINAFENNLSNVRSFLDVIIKCQIIKSYCDFIEIIVTYWLLKPFDATNDFDDVLLRLYLRIEAVCSIIEDRRDLNFVWSKCRVRFEDCKRPFKAFIAAILCRSISQKFTVDISDDDSKWEQLSDDFCLWSLLIGKLEDIAILEIITEHEFSLNEVVNNGRDSVTKLVSNWLIDVNIEMKEFFHLYEMSESSIESESVHKTVTDLYRLLQKQFPFSLQKNVMLADLSCNYIEKWTKNKQFNHLDLMVKYLKEIKSDHSLKIGMHYVIWRDYLRNIFESICRLMNTVGKIPKEKLCRQDIAMSDIEVRNFLTVVMDFFDSFVDSVDNVQTNKFLDDEDTETGKKSKQSELLWDTGDEKVTLIDEASKVQLNYNILTIHHELCTVLNLIEAFNIRWPKFLTNLFEPSVSSCFFADFCNTQCQIQYCYNSKLKKTQTDFLMGIIHASIDLSVIDDATYSKEYKKVQLQIMSLASEWDLNIDQFRRFQIQQLYANGYDNLTIELLPAVTNSNDLAIELLKILGLRLKYFIDQEFSSTQTRSNFPLLHPTVLNYLNSLDSKGKPSSLVAIQELARVIVRHFTDEKSYEFKVAVMIAEACSKM